MSRSAICSINKLAGLAGLKIAKHLYLYLIVWGAAYEKHKKHWLPGLRLAQVRHASEAKSALQHKGGTPHTEYFPRVMKSNQM
jgi:hypothetical protein